MERDAADAGAFSLVHALRVWRRESPSNLPMVARGGMGGTATISKIEPASDFCGKTARCLYHNVL